MLFVDSYNSQIVWSFVVFSDLIYLLFFHFVSFGELEETSGKSLDKAEEDGIEQGNNKQES